MCMKTCHKCKISKVLDEFPKNKTRFDGRSETCLQCKREYNKVHYQNNKRYYIDKADSYVIKLRDWLFSYKGERGCKYCEEGHPACLQFHHRDPKSKLCEVSTLLSKQKSKQEVLKEIKKCDLVCANCHAKLHCKRKWPPECAG